MNHAQNLRDQLVASHTLPSEEMSANRYWSLLGFDADGDSYIVPESVVVIETTTASKPSQIGVPPGLAINDGPRKLYFYREGKDLDFPTLDGWLGSDGHLYCPGQPIKLPTADWNPPAAAVKHHTAFTVLNDADIPDRDDAPEAAHFESPLLKYSLRGKSEEFQNSAVESSPLLGDICRKGQVTILYGPPNVGKTLILLSLVISAVQEGRIDPNRVLYVNADDNSEGISQKMRILDDLGCHTLVPGYNGFKPANLIADMRQMAEKDQARGTLIIIDTIKKFASIMDKKESSNFGDASRQLTIRGGAVVGMAHVNKNTDVNGRARYAGTTDLIEDSDGAYQLSSIGDATVAGERIVKFERLKARSNSPEQAAYAYSSEAGLSYEERVASVRPVDLDALHSFQVETAQRNDAELIEATQACLAEGIVTKMALAKEVSNRLGVSQRDSIRLIERYTGTDPAFHRWNYTVANHGKHVFAALTDPAADPA